MRCVFYGFALSAVGGLLGEDFISFFFKVFSVDLFYSVWCLVSRVISYFFVVLSFNYFHLKFMFRLICFRSRVKVYATGCYYRHDSEDPKTIGGRSSKNYLLKEFSTPLISKKFWSKRAPD